jgi:hypothetical protein
MSRQFFSDHTDCVQVSFDVSCAHLDVQKLCPAAQDELDEASGATSRERGCAKRPLGVSRSPGVAPFQVGQTYGLLSKSSSE